MAKKVLSTDQVTLLLLPGLEYNKVIVNVAKELTGKKVCYITLNKTYDWLKELYSKHNVDLKNFVFVDAISSLVRHVDSTKQCHIISSPSALEELSLMISKLLQQNFDYIVFDSLTNLLIYREEKDVEKFMSVLVNSVRATKSQLVFYAINLDEHKEMVKKASMFVDSVDVLKV